MTQTIDLCNEEGGKRPGYLTPTPLYAIHPSFLSRIFFPVPFLSMIKTSPCPVHGVYHWRYGQIIPG
jgi:hypothetical protein